MSREVCKRIIEDLPSAMDKYGIESLRDIIGGVRIMGKDVIIACDFDSKEKTLEFLDRFTGREPVS